ncbi:MAG TPA: hypothetical protein PL063_01240 [Candidatus Cloacimonadota bacterium]|jgi:hypothetical protein|nr:hypothetical protein [Candidatus Cloacimonadales bacterium]HPY95816.1 hypothetical protein [Candidatus Cloacimonadota bacterium]HQB40519.1 hypothetical protein [Candidatus Cloacimonadota bacterium]
MSWLFCVISNKPFLKWEIDKFIQTHKQTSSTLIKPSFYLAFSDAKHNVTVHYDNYEQKSGWIVLGNGYLTKETGYGVAEKNDWKRLIDGDINSQDMNGNYLVFKWNEQFIEAWNDTLGVQSLYYTKCQGYVVLSSRLDWTLPFLDNKPWNYNAFGAFALLPQFLLSDSLLKNVSKLGASSYLKANINNFQEGTRNYDLLCDQSTDLNQYFFKLNKSISIIPDAERKLLLEPNKSLTNSFILSILLNKPNKNWSILEPFEKEELDQFIAFQDLFHFNSEQNPGYDDKKRLFNLWNEYILSTLHYDIPYELNYIQFANKLNQAGYSLNQTFFSHFFFRNTNYNSTRLLIKAIKENNVDSVLKYFSQDTSWLRDDFKKFLKKGLSSHLHSFQEQIELNTYKSDEQKDQMIMLLSKGIHYYSTKQAFFSQYTNIYNPFLLVDLLKARINLEIKPSALFKEYHNQIARNYPELLFHAKTKEIKYSLNDKQSIDTMMFDFFKTEIINSLNKSEVQLSPYYNHKKIAKIISKASSGNIKYIQMLLKCYSFELIRSYFE